MAEKAKEPKAKPDEKPRRSIRCTDEEWSAITKLAEMEGGNRSHYILDRVLGPEIKGTRTHGALLENIARDIENLKVAAKFLGFGVIDWYAKNGQDDLANERLRDANGYIETEANPSPSDTIGSVRLTTSFPTLRMCIRNLRSTLAFIWRR